MNLRVLKPSRKRLQVGDIFVLQVEDEQFLFGRVIRIERQGGPMIAGFILIYIYNAKSDTKDHIPLLRKDRLLVPPIMTNRLPWSKGYFEVVENRVLSEADVLQPHCFEDLAFGGFRDESGRMLRARIEPCGVYALHSYRTIDDAVSEALGVPLSQD